jgi:hypothetical protein
VRVVDLTGDRNGGRHRQNGRDHHAHFSFSFLATLARTMDAGKRGRRGSSELANHDRFD